MSNVSLYDITGQQWYEQPTTGNIPSVLTQGYTVLVSAQDGSSHNIYWYGGFNGFSISQTLSDDVWVLSIPSFIWTKLYPGDASYGRAGHVCAKPYPDQMIVDGGSPSLGGFVLPCIKDLVRIFNLSSVVWLDTYDQISWSNYSVPKAIYSVIGGSATGGAIQTEPAPLGFTNDHISNLSKRSYDISKIKTYYPYSTVPNIPSPIMNSSGKPKYLAPVLGVVLGLFFIIVLWVVWFWRRRLLRARAETYSENDQSLDLFGGAREKRSLPLEIDGTASHQGIPEAGGTNDP